MKTQLTTMVLMTVMAAAGHGATNTRIEVYLNDRDDSSLLLGPGTSLATALFDKIGVRLSWHSGALPAGRTAYFVRTLEHAPASATPGALASTQLLGPSVAEITVYRDRVRRFLANHPSLNRVAAGYVLAHELAHVMQGIPRHSDSGILKAQWSADDYTAMMYHKLAFTALDAELIRHGITPASAGE